MESNQHPTHYQIHIKGHLDERRMRWFEGLDVAQLPNGKTIISGPVMDQAALHGLLNRIRDLGMELISVQPKTRSTYEPTPLEIQITLALGLTVLSPYYRRFVQDLHLRGNEHVLDFGSGSGICSRHLAARLKRSGGNLACVDISSGWMKIVQNTLRRYKNVSYHFGHITDVGLPNSYFEMVVIHFVLHDIPENERLCVLHSLARRLKPEGRLILREPEGHGLTLEELNQLAVAVGLHPLESNTRKLIIGSVFDACFTLQQNSS
jgi:2-polyprenyl-3-methyl-5-hydroxy-6-metoxy-1,4-benzoquinol methylase